MQLFCYLIEIYLIICIVRVVLSWLDMLGQGGVLAAVGTIAYTLTEPVFATVRRYLPQFGDLPIDFSPLIVMLGLGFLQRIVC